jgi:hypothetical protein
VFCAEFFGLLVLGVRLLGFALRAQDDGQIGVGQRIARIELDCLPVLGDRLGAVAICVGIDFGAISSVTRLPYHAARSIV